MTTAGMATELYKTLASRGLDPAAFALVPFGGAGPTHANLLAEEAGISHIVIPPAAGTFCALGAAAADLRRDFVRSLRCRLDETSTTQLFAVLDELSSEGYQWLDREGDANQTRRLERGADMRYAGQAYELRVTFDETCRHTASIAEAFHLEHERIYGFRDTDTDIEIGTVRLAMVGVKPKFSQPEIAPGRGDPTPKGDRRIFRRGQWIYAGVYDREALGAGDHIVGPAIIEQDDTTTVVMPNWSARVDPVGNLHLERDAQ